MCLQLLQIQHGKLAKLIANQWKIKDELQFETESSWMEPDMIKQNRILKSSIYGFFLTFVILGI